MSLSKLRKQIEDEEKKRTDKAWQRIEFTEMGKICGNSAHVRIPKAWIGKMIHVKLEQEEKK